MIKREKDYLKKQKKKHLIGTLIWLAVMFGIFGIGYFLNRTRNNIFTVIAALFVLPAAQDMTKLIAILKFKDPDIETSKKLEDIKGEYNIFHGVLIPDVSSIYYYDHIVVTGTKIYCIIDSASNISKKKEVFNKKIEAKAIPLKTVIYIESGKTKEKGNIFKKIERNAEIANKENLNEYTQLIAQMMM